jgi:polar amino acid transport system substrate-binding protein
MLSTRPGRHLAAALATALIAACALSTPATAQTTLARLRAKGVVRIGFANEAPFDYRDADGRLTGSAPEVARVIFKRLGIPKVEGVMTEFGSLVPGLKAGRFDVVAAGMYILPKRCRQVAFSEPTYSVGEGFVVARGNPLHLHSYADIRKNSDAILGLMAGSVETGYAKAEKIPADRLRFFPDGPSAVAAVAAHRIDAYAGTSLSVASLARKAGGRVELAKPFQDPVVNGRSVRGYGAFAFRKGDEALLAAFNAALKAYLPTKAHTRLMARFGFGPDEAPGSTTTAQLCAGR